jgi:TetR/AcrR family transcriptional regulator, transcriptional repressor for nem operon
MDTRTALLNSAETACRQRGFDGFSYSDMARDVGIAKPSIHHHFPVKADLALALLERYSDSFISALEDISTSNQSAGAMLADYVQLYKNALKGGTCVCLCVAFSAGRASLSDDVIMKLNHFHELSINWLETLFRKASHDHSIGQIADHKSEAAATLALMEGAQLVARAAFDAVRFDQAVSILLSRISR